MARITNWNGVSEVPRSPCEYKLYKGEELIRNGSSCDCQRRLREHKSGIAEATGFTVRLTESCSEAREIEKAYCKRYKPPLNERCG